MGIKLFIQNKSICIIIKLILKSGALWPVANMCLVFEITFVHQGCSYGVHLPPSSLFFALHQKCFINALNTK